MSHTRTVLALAVICLGHVHARGEDGVVAHTPADELRDVRDVLRHAIAHNKLSPLHNRPISLLDVLYESRWRHSIRHVVRLLIESSNPDDRLIGWRLAHENAERMEWSATDIDRIVAEPSDEVKMAAIRSVAATDGVWIGTCIARILEDPTATTRVKKVCVSQLNKVPTRSDRIRLWRAAAGDDALRAQCLSSFPFVSSSEAAIQVVASWLDDTSTVHVAVSDDFGVPTEIRVLACQALSMVDVHRKRVADELLRRCKMSPDRKHLEFFIAAVIAIHRLKPESSESIDRLMQWYDELTAARPVFLQSLEEDLWLPGAFESLVIARTREMSAAQKYCACQWLSSRRSRKAATAVNELLRDPHPGVRVAAAVALSKMDPLCDLSTTREDLLKAAVSSPKEFMIAFPSMTDAVLALALAGQSDEEAIEWLKFDRDAELRAICEEARDVLSAEIATGIRRGIPWKKTAGVEGAE